MKTKTLGEILTRQDLKESLKKISGGKASGDCCLGGPTCATISGGYYNCTWAFDRCWQGLYTCNVVDGCVPQERCWCGALGTTQHQCD
ncbi:MAG: hypothetical protein QM528_03930 [Phycisphaerales bacterium]|nr:hypothetical protein [Phycisphaerales bacterium]